jgi:hypothetical protein
LISPARSVLYGGEFLMIRRTRLWRIGAALFVLINVAGAGYAAAMGERMHLDTHLVLLAAGAIAYLMARAVAQRRRRETLPPVKQGDERGLEYLQQSVDAMALEVERIGEAQRFNEKLQGERAGNPAKPEIPPPKKEQ